MSVKTHNSRKKILLLPGDGIGSEVIHAAEKVINALSECGHGVDTVSGLIGGAAYDVCGKPLPDETLVLARECDAVLLGAVGAPQYDTLERALRPESGLLNIRKSLNLFANLRPAQVFPELVAASTLKPEVVSGLDLMIIRELTGGIYFGQPRGIGKDDNNRRLGVNTLIYNEDEIERIARVAFEVAKYRQRRLCSVDKANVLEVSELWRTIVTEVAADYPEVTLTHIYVDNAAMQLVRDPGQFDVLVTSNMFGDILSDLAAMLTGSIGMLPSASLDSNNKGLYEPVHGAAPDIAGTGKANPLATILSLAMLFRYSLQNNEAAERIENAVRLALGQARTADLDLPVPLVSTDEMADIVSQNIIVDGKKDD